MEICFVPDNDYGGFLEKAKLVRRHRGEIVDQSGRVLGHHDGIEFFTLGQRRGLKVPAREPWYVVGLDPEGNRVIVGRDEDLMSTEFEVERCNWIPSDAPEGSFEAMTKIRYNHSGTVARVTALEGGRARVELSAAQRAVTPGQACVFYDGDLVVGGGWIRGVRGSRKSGVGCKK